MVELFTMWRNTRMIVLTAICAAAYVAIMIPFKGLIIVPGFTEIRPGAAIPVVLSFLFGPAAAWGSGFGNLIADALGGQFGPGSIPGFLGNFFYGYLPYALWRAFFGHKNPVESGASGWCMLGLILVTNAIAIGAIIGWGVDALGLVPFKALAPVIFANNLLISASIAMVLLVLLYKRVETWGLLYFQILDDYDGDFSDAMPDEVQEFSKQTQKDIKTRPLAKIGAVICMSAAVTAFALGMIIASGDVGSMQTALSVGSVLVVFLIGSLFL